MLGFSLFQDGDVGGGILPEGEEVFIGGERSDAGGMGIMLRWDFSFAAHLHAPITLTNLVSANLPSRGRAPGVIECLTIR